MKLLNNAYRSLTVIKKRSKFESYRSFLSDFPSTPLCHKGENSYKRRLSFEWCFLYFSKIEVKSI